MSTLVMFDTLKDRLSRRCIRVSGQVCHATRRRASAEASKSCVLPPNVIKL